MTKKLLGCFGALMNAEGGSGGGGGQPTAFQYPQGYPDQFKGATVEESLGKLFGGYGEVNTRADGLRGELARRPAPPASADLYTFEPNEKLKPVMGDLTKDPVFGLAKTVFHKHGIPQEGFAGVIGDLYGQMQEKGMLAAPFDPANEVKSFMTATGMDAKAATDALGVTETFAKGLLSQLKDVPDALKEDVQAQLMSLTDSAAGNVLLRALSGRLAENGIRVEGDGTHAGELTMEDLKKLGADPRIDPDNRNHADPAKRFDPALRKRYDDGYARHSRPRQ